MSPRIVSSLVVTGLLVTGRSAVADAPPADRMGVVLGARVGATAPQPFSELGSFVLAGAEVGYIVPALERRVQLGAGVMYSRPPASGGEGDMRLSGGAYEWELEQQLLVLEVGAVVRVLGVDRTVAPYVRAGLRAYMLETRLRGSSGTDAGFGEHREGSNELGVGVGAGVDIAFGPGAFTGDVGLGFSDLDEELTGDASSGALEIAIGYRLFL